MSASQIFTIGTALRRAEDNGIPVEVLVEGQWITGSIAGLDGDGLVLVTPEQVQCVVRNAHISVVRLLAARLDDEAPSEPREAPYENVVRDAPREADQDPAETAQVWAMPAAESTATPEIEHDHEEVFVVGTTLDEGPLELPAPVLVEEALDEPVDLDDLVTDDLVTDDLVTDAEEPAEEERGVFALPAATHHDPTDEDPTHEDPTDEIEDHLAEAEPEPEPEPEPELTADPEPDPEPEPENAGSATTGEEWRDMLIALRAEAPDVTTTPAPERRRGRRLVMR